MSLSRRELLRSGAAAAGAVVLVPAFLRDAFAGPALPGPSPYGVLGAPDANGLMLPSGFQSRVIGVAGQPHGGKGYVLPPFPDGQATYKTNDGGWILVTNSESAIETGGVSATRFTADGTITDAYRICGGTVRNCAGGPTPWGAWLTGEEHDGGMIWECDPAGKLAAQARPGCGVFIHEAAAVDPIGKRVYLSEDNPLGGFYRFTPNSYPDLSAGTLEVAERAGDGNITWHKVPDPTTTQTGVPVNLQVPLATKFNGGEGLWYANGVVYYSTKGVGDKRVYAYSIGANNMEVIYDFQLTPAASQENVDNVTVTAFGEILVCEDGNPDPEVGLITPGPDRTISPLVRFTGAEHVGSELCGVVFNPSQTRLYVTSQRAAIAGGPPNGAIYEISGPFRIPSSGIPADLIYGPPVGEPAPKPEPTPSPSPTPPGPAPTPTPIAPDRKKPVVKVVVSKRPKRPALLSRGLEVRVTVDEPASVGVLLDSAALKTPKRQAPTHQANTVLARLKKAHKGGGSQLKLRLRVSATGKRRLRAVRKPVKARVLVTARDAAGNETSVVTRITIGRA